MGSFLGIVQEGSETVAVKRPAPISIRVFGQTAQVNKGGIKIDQAYGVTAFLPPTSSIWHPNDQGNTGGFLPDGHLEYLVLFPHMEPVVTGDDHNGIVGILTLVQRIKDAADLGVGK